MDVKDMIEFDNESKEYIRPAYLDCKHEYRDITEERESAVQAMPVPDWYKKRMEVEFRGRKLTESLARRGLQRFEKCHLCGLVKLGKKEPIASQWKVLDSK